jgi:hypothetical protein
VVGDDNDLPGSEKQSKGMRGSGGHRWNVANHPEQSEKLPATVSFTLPLLFSKSKGEEKGERKFSKDRY